MRQLEVLPRPFFPGSISAGLMAFVAATSGPFATSAPAAITVSPWTSAPQVVNERQLFPSTEPPLVLERSLPTGDLVITRSVVHTSSADLVRSIHDISGLTWEQIAKMFTISRRAVHSWANGARVSARNLEALSQLAGALEGRRGFSPDDNRIWLLDSSEGPSRYDRIRGRNDKAVLEALVPAREQLGLA